MVTRAFNTFKQKLQELEVTVNECEIILVSDSPVEFVSNHANFLTKSFLISFCGHLETYLKDVLEIMLMDYNDRIKNENFPHNLIRWSIENKSNASSKVASLLEDKNKRFEDLEIKLKKKDLDAFISGNPFRTKQLFEMFGVNLSEDEYYMANKELIQSIITRRNNVLHHNDQASDLTNIDIISYISQINDYALAIDKIIEPKITNRQHCI
jgi:hypothetical protein